MPTTAIVLAAGMGTRFKQKLSKPLFKINAHPIIAYSLKELDRHSLISDIVLVVNAINKSRLIAAIKPYKIKKLTRIVEGGKRRQDSVFNGLRAITCRSGFVLIHDSARPFLDRRMISSAIKAAQDYGAAVVGVPVKATIKQVRSKVRGAGSNYIVEKTLDRRNLWEIQTPQVFKKDLILVAYERFGNAFVTDDASLVEKSGVRVKVVMGSYFNIKITTPEDLVLAEAISNLRCLTK